MPTMQINDCIILCQIIRPFDPRSKFSNNEPERKVYCLATSQPHSYISEHICKEKNKIQMTNDKDFL